MESARSRLVVISPHLDDAAFSLGAAIAYASRGDVPVMVLTVFAGDPSSPEPAGTWDKLCGFVTAGDAAQARRVEDSRACEILGAEPVWLPFAYGDYAGVRNEDQIWKAVRPHLDAAALTLVPGYPLVHPDHAWLTQLVARRLPASRTLGLYVEQPYANLTVIGRGYAYRSMFAAAAIALRTPRGLALQEPALGDVHAALFDAPLEWRAAYANSNHRRAKIESIAAYASQRRWLGRRLLSRICLYEWGWGGEGVGLPAVEPAPPHRRHRIPRWDARALVNESRTRLGEVSADQLRG